MSEEELELRDLVAQTLENNGVLSRIRAELRASVFLALEEQESVMETDQFINKPLKAFLSTNEGALAASLVREFLEFFKLDFTLSVFDPETAQGKYYNYGGRSKLMKDLKVDSINGKKGPLLAQILHIALSQTVESSDAVKDENKPNSGKSIATIDPLAQNGALTDNSSNSASGEKPAIPSNVNLLRSEVTTTKENSNNVPLETKPVSLVPEISKQIGDTNKVPRLKEIPLPVASEENSPRSVSSELEDASQSSKESNRSKTGSSQITPRNSLIVEPSPTHTKPESQDASNSESSQKMNSSKTDSKKKKPQQTSKRNVDPVAKPTAGSTLSSLGNLPPLMGVNFSAKQPPATLPGINQQKDMHQIKAMIDLGLESQDNYDEDFHSSASNSAREDRTNQGTDTEIEEELASGVDDLLSSASGMDDMTADATISNLSGVADYIEDVK
ncbi:centrosomal protein 43-like [Periplaneta americana]|uniref:centrosomal protein 43-like n=1 Tax=Periplaneta americana TaxID=6978 RepID=UPI0037E78D92